MAIDPATDHVYQEEINQFNRLSSWVYTLVGIDLDIEDDAGNVVWSADNTIHDIDAARRVLTGMGLVDQQMVAILNAAQDLTAVVSADPDDGDGLEWSS